MSVQRLIGTLTLSILLAPAVRAASQFGIPPEWNTNEPTATTLDRGNILGEKKKIISRSKSSSFPVKAAAGLFTGFPDGRGAEGFLFFGRYLGIRAFYAPKMTIDVRVEMPAEVLSAKQGIAVANPEYTILGDLVTGPNSGAEILYFPFGGSFYLAGGAATRKIALTAHARSPVLICSVLEAQKKDPCSDPTASLKTRIEADIDASLSTSALMLKGGLGWYWHISSFGYLSLGVGAGKPTKIVRESHADANIVVPGEEDPAINGALLDLKNTREADVEKKAEKAVSPFDQKIMPVVALGIGLRI